MIALDAKLKLRKGADSRIINLEDFFITYKKTVIQQGEFIESIIIPKPNGNQQLITHKMSKRYEDDIQEEVKKRRLQEIVDVQWVLSNESNKKDVGKIFEVLIEGNSKKSNEDWMGRNSQNKVIVFPKGAHEFKKGDYVNVLVSDFTKGTLLGTVSNK